MKKLDITEIHERMETIDASWILKGKFIHRDFIFKDFIEAFSFMTSVAFLSEKANHHPNWKNAYKKVSIALSTHEVDGLTEKDFELASKIDRLVKKE